MNRPAKSKRSGLTAATVALSLAAACGSDGSNPGAGNTPGTGLQTLSLSEAPAATQTFYWGDTTVTSPGFAGEGTNLLTLSLDGQGRLRYRAFRVGFGFDETFGDQPGDFPLAGTKHVELGNPGYDVTVEDTSPATALHFATHLHVVGGPVPVTDLIETLDGVRATENDGWQITYALVGRLWSSSIDMHATGVVYAGGPPVAAPAPGQKSFWSGPVALSAPGFAGDPIDRLTVALDEKGAIHAMMFDLFSTGAADYLDQPADFVLADFTLNPHRSDGPADVAVTFDATAPPTASHFVSRFHVVAPSLLSDFVEGIDGTREGNGLVVRYFFRGTDGTVPLEAHAAGTLSPIDEPPFFTGSGGAEGGGTGGAGGTGGMPGTGGVFGNDGGAPDASEGTGGTGGSSAMDGPGGRYLGGSGGIP